MAMGPVVAVEISTSGAEAGYAAALVAACTRAVPRGSCALADAAPGSRNAKAIAIVSWRGSQQTDVRVQVGVRRATGGTAWLARDMHFSDADAPIERWRAVGLTIATLVGELPPPPAEVQAPPAPAPGPRTVPVPRRTDQLPEEPGPERWWLEAGGLVGPGLDTGSWRGGAWIAGARRFARTPFFVHAFASYAARPADVRGMSASFVDVAAGPGAFVVLPSAELTLDGRIALGLERVHASARAGGAEESGSRVVPALRLGGNVAWPRGYVSVVVGGDMWVNESATDVRVEGERRGRAPPVGGELRVGIRVALP